MKKVNKKKGFTLVELAIVIAVIAILAAILVPTLTTVLSKANKQKDSTTVNKAIQAFVTDNVDVVEDFEDCYVVYSNGSKTLVYHIVNASVDGNELESSGSGDYITVSGDAVTLVDTAPTSGVYYKKESKYNTGSQYENKLGTDFVVYVKVTTPASGS